MKLLDPISPGDILLEEFIKPLGITMSKCARDIAVPSGRITDIVHSKRDITPDTAYRLGKYFKTGPEFWLNLQMTYKLRQAKQAWDTIKSTIKTCPEITT